MKKLADDKNELSVWGLADEGWRKVLEQQLDTLQEQRNRRLNTPKAANIDDLFFNALGISKISSTWKWDKTNATKARNHLDKFVELRGAVAHRGKAGAAVKKKQATDYFDLVKKLAAKTGGKVNTHVKSITGKSLW